MSRSDAIGATMGFLVACAAVCVSTSSPVLGQRFEDHARVLLEDRPGEWPAAVTGLIESKSYPETELMWTQVGRRLATPEKTRIARWFHNKYYVHRPGPVMDLLADLAIDPDAKVRETARGALKRAHYTYALDRLVHVARTTEIDRPEVILELMASHSMLRRLHLDVRDRSRDRYADSFPRIERSISALLPGWLEDDDPAVRAAAIRAIASIERAAGLDKIAPLLTDPDEKVSYRAREALSYYRDVRAFDAAFERARSHAEEGRRRYLLRSIGRQYRGAILETVLDRLKTASKLEQIELSHVLSGITRLKTLERIRTLEAHPRNAYDEVRRRIEGLLAYSKANYRPPTEESRGGWTDLFLSLACIVAAGMGFVIFLWAYRTWKMRRLVHDLATSKVRSVAIGSVAIEGVACSAGGSTEHPLTGERCVYHPRDGHQKFYVQDDTGQILVEARGAVLVSEDGTVTPGERVHIVATARQSENTSSIVLGKASGDNSLWDKMCGLFLRFAFGRGDAGAASRMLFQNPRDFCWIWDDANGKPLQSARETAVLLGTFAFSGIWIVFGVAVFVSVVGG